jgi:transmembrane sensor
MDSKRIITKKVQRELLDKFLNDKCTDEEVLEIIGYFKNESIPEVLRKDFENSWLELTKEGLKPKDWSRVIEELKLKIMVNDLIKSDQNFKSHREFKRNTKSMEIRDRSPLPRKNNRSVIRKIPIYLTAAIVIGIFSITLFRGKEIKPSTTEAAVITKTNPKGQKMTIHLNDGSSVVLNSSSSISYPESFSDTVRHIHLAGEAYFEVAEDKSRPFIVSTSNLNVKVLGTVFNVKANDILVEVALASGRVLVSNEGGDIHGNINVDLEPGEKLVVNQKNQQIKKSQFIFDEEFSWKNGVIYFSNATFEEVIRKLEDWYGVEFTFEGKPNHAWDFTAKFKSESLKTVLDAIGYAKQFKYELKDKKVHLKLNNNR